jgi:hypothetical protein
VGDISESELREMSTGNDEWRNYRRDNLEFIRGHRFKWTTYAPPSPHWDHDHCTGCQNVVTFTTSGAPDTLDAGYMTLREYRGEFKEETFDEERKLKIVWQPHVDGYLHEWVCPECFEEFKDELDFKLLGDQEN